MRYYGIWTVQHRQSTFEATEGWCNHCGALEIFQSEDAAQQRALNYNEHADANIRYCAREMDSELAQKTLQQIKDKVAYLHTTEILTEQNYNMIDGLQNNQRIPAADLTDGQTYEEITELAPETLPERASVMKQIRESCITNDCEKERPANFHIPSRDGREL